MERRLILCEMELEGSKAVFSRSEKAQRDYSFRLFKDGLMSEVNGEIAQFRLDYSKEINPGDKFRLILERIQA